MNLEDTTNTPSRPPNTVALDFKLHFAQRKVFNAKKRFKVVAAGRRFGKTHLALVMLIIWAMSSTKKQDLYYVAPTFQQGKDIAWNALKMLLGPLLVQAHENTGVCTLVNGNRIHIKGSDRPDTLRGVALLGLVVDEYADMKPFVWDEILSACLMDVQAPALFIGTPKGRNHFYDLCQMAAVDIDWGYWHFVSGDNPFLPKSEIEAARRRSSTFAFQQEYEASFNTAASEIFKPEWIKERDDEPEDGLWLASADLAGFEDELTRAQGGKASRRDNSAITTAKIYGDDEWWVKNIDAGRWSVAETARRLVAATKDTNALILGIEKGIAQQAVIPYLLDEMQRQAYRPQIKLLTHGNQRKQTRITWGLQGMLEKGYITFNPGPYMRPLRDELLQFPSPQSRDDMIDSLSYIRQLVDAVSFAEVDYDTDGYSPIDSISGI